MEKGLSEWIAMTNSRKMWYDMIVNEGNIKVNFKKRFKKYDLICKNKTTHKQTSGNICIQIKQTTYQYLCLKYNDQRQQLIARNLNLIWSVLEKYFFSST